MKYANLLLILISVVLFSCTNNNGPLTQPEKEKLIAEVDAVMNTMKEGMKNLDVSKAFETTFLLNNDFKYIDIHGKVLSSEAFLEEVHSYFDVAKKIEFVFSSQDIRIVTPNVVIVTLIYHGTFYFPDSILTPPDCGSTFVLNKTVNGWKVIHLQESLQESEFVITEVE